MGHKDIKVGEKVYAKWPGSGKYYEAVIDEVLEGEYVITFSEGSLSTIMDEKHVYRATYFGNRSRSASSPARRSRSPGRRRSRSRSPSRRSTSTPKKSPQASPTRRGRSPGRPRKYPKEDPKEEPIETKEETKTPGRGRPKKQVVQEPAEQQVVQEPAEQTPAKPKPPIQQQQTTVTHLTRSMTKTMVIEEKEALLNTEKLEQEFKESKAKGKEFEFGGPVGVFFLMLALPAMVYAIYFYCNGKNSVCSFIDNPIKLPHWRKYFDEGHLIYDAFILFQLILYFVPFGKVAQGPVFPDGTRKTYRLNGLLAFTATLAALFVLKSKKVQLEMVYDKLPSLITAALIWCIVISIFVYVKARYEGTGLSVPGNTGNAVYDFFIGHQFYPSIGKFDFKFFCESRPSLLGWMVINFCMANHQYETFHKISPAMMMVCLFQVVYVLDAMIFEATLLSMIDMTHDGFGFMLAFGNLVFVPYMFTIQTRFLSDHKVDISWQFIVAIVLLKVVGYIIFRGSNLQKDFFRQQPDDPDFQDKETILTPSGKRLMVFGWWKMVRHPNYLGDILMAISWSFPCGFNHIIPWLYPIYLIIFLVHRERRDEALCRKKYGKSYDEYCRRVPYRIVPLVY